MKKKAFILVLLATTLLVGCKKEGNTSKFANAQTVDSISQDTVSSNSVSDNEAGEYITTAEFREYYSLSEDITDEQIEAFIKNKHLTQIDLETTDYGEMLTKLYTKEDKPNSVYGILNGSEIPYTAISDIKDCTYLIVQMYKDAETSYIVADLTDKKIYKTTDPEEDITTLASKDITDEWIEKTFQGLEDAMTDNWFSVSNNEGSYSEAWTICIVTKTNEIVFVNGVSPSEDFAGFEEWYETLSNAL